MSSLKKFKVTIPYFDSGTKKEHTVDFLIDAKDPAGAVSSAREKFDAYEKSSHASWVRIIREDGIRVEEK
ncbi:MAG: hypothetical protein ACD_47C00269G0001 [uncultured bacterium]|uniref:Uncharacterized protein n=1 Tax=Candidatus Wallbacteria bacterium GWC2_49_35 TaxID=1817813 RepID=A0A1F7WHF1_9BACT|nr:MAG: hypothetical protein ACD_47C00269G0001 [uncultured bacterium]OGM02231.1 MAG: hypothetical protein A2008_09030 [Candidatus Wallbacteria bacterium GWC2_49_35]HBC74673.1 hypothetical protein [Candidatus Wallbacteria bacterium]